MWISHKNSKSNMNFQNLARSAGDFFSGFRSLEYIISFTKMYFDTSNPKKNPPAAGYFHVFAPQKCSLKIEIRQKSPAASYILYIAT